MAAQLFDRADRDAGKPLLRGVVTILLVGGALGVVFNWLGLSSQPAWGLPWIAKDKLADMASLESIEAVDGSAGPPSTYGDASDDPMAIPATAGLPQIPDLDRPIQIQLDAVKQLFDADAAFVIDAREAPEYAVSHIPGALSLPYEEVSSEPERLESLDSGGRPIIVYCGGGNCEVSLNLAWDLIYAGQRKVVVYMGGFPEWEAAGYPVEGDPAEESRR